MNPLWVHGEAGGRSPWGSCFVRRLSLVGNSSDNEGRSPPWAARCDDGPETQVETQVKRR